MQVKGFIKLVSFITIMALMPMSVTHAGCPCEAEGEAKYSQDKELPVNTEDPD